MISSVGVAISVHHQVRAAIATSHAAAAAAAHNACRPTRPIHRRCWLPLCSRNWNLLHWPMRVYA